MSTRMQRADSQIQRALSEILLKEMNDPRFSKLITITSTKTTPDFKYCKVLVSILSEDEEERKATHKLLVKSGSYIRKMLVDSVRLPQAPKLVFELDEGAIHSERINEILENLQIPPIVEDEE